MHCILLYRHNSISGRLPTKHQQPQKKQKQAKEKEAKKKQKKEKTTTKTKKETKREENSEQVRKRGLKTQSAELWSHTSEFNPFGSAAAADDDGSATGMYETL